MNRAAIRFAKVLVLALLLFIAGVLSIFCIFNLRRPVAIPREPWPALMAHRGLPHLAPENTLASFGVALELSFDIELDVYQTADDEVVVMHDDTVDRTTDGTGVIGELSLAQIKSLDAGSWFDSAFANERVPTLAETLELVKQRQRRTTTIAVNLKKITTGLEERIVAAVERAEMLDQVFCYAMDEKSNARFKKANPEIRTAISTRGFERFDLKEREDWLRAIEFADADILWVNFVPSADLVRAADDRGKRVWVRLTDRFDPRQVTKAVNHHVDGICSEDVLEMRLLRQQKSK